MATSTDVLSRESVVAALDTIDGRWKDRVYSTLVTLWVFLGQVLSAYHSCRKADSSPGFARV